jgi:hypothetical protein
VDQEVAAIEKRVGYFHSSQEKGTCYTSVVTTERTRVDQESEKHWGSMTKGLYWGFHGKKQAR